MKTSMTFSYAAILCAAMALPLPAAVATNDVTGNMYDSPQAAVAALAAAVTAHDTKGMRAIFGPAGADLLSPDPTQASNEFASFVGAFLETNRLVRASDTSFALEIGHLQWPFTVPVVVRNGKWFFDTQTGKEELISRRIGRDELRAINVARAYVDAQREYAALDRDSDEVLEYAQKLVSTPGEADGLYWSEDTTGNASPLGPLVAQAQREGYSTTNATGEPQPYHGYFFRVLTRQGASAPGGKYKYVINGNMIAGFGLVAYPAEYGSSGIMTFIVNQQGVVYQKDLASDTLDIAGDMDEYDLDATWTKTKD